ncbi:hypothetical protein J6590_030157, partial [Homalodisca vitripennis]
MELSPRSHRKCFRDAAHNDTPPPLLPNHTHKAALAALLDLYVYHYITQLRSLGSLPVC